MALAWHAYMNPEVKTKDHSLIEREHRLAQVYVIKWLLNGSSSCWNITNYNYYLYYNCFTAL